MKDFYILELLTDLLTLPFEKNLFDITDLSTEDAEIVRIFKLTYRLIKHVIKEYRPNELYAA